MLGELVRGEYCARCARVKTKSKEKGRIAPAILRPWDSLPSAHQPLPVQLDSIQAPKQRDRDLAWIEEALCHRLNLCRRNGIDFGDDLVCTEELAEVNLLPRQVGHARVRAFQAHQDVALELVLGAGQFFVAERFFLQLAEFRHHQADAFKRLRSRGPRIYAERSRIPVRAEIA